MPPKRSTACGHRRLHARLVADVALQRQRLAAGGLDLGGGAVDRARQLRVGLGRLGGDRRCWRRRAPRACAIARPMPREAPVMKRVLPRRSIASPCRLLWGFRAAVCRKPATAPRAAGQASAGPHAGRAPRRRRDRPARPDGSRRSPSSRASARRRSSRTETSLRVAAQRASAWSWRRASRADDAAQRLAAGAGTGASAAAARRRRGAPAPAPSSQSASAARCARARRTGTWSTTSLTPVIDDRDVRRRRRRRAQQLEHGARGEAGAGAKAPLRSARARCACQRADQVADHRLVLMGDADAGGRRIAGDEEPQRRALAAPGAASRLPAASGSTGARRRVAQRLRHQQRRQRELEGQRQRRMREPRLVRRPTGSELGEVGLALLEEGTERLLGLGALQPRREDAGLDADRLVQRRRAPDSDASAAWSRAPRPAAAR